MVSSIKNGIGAIYANNPATVTRTISPANILPKSLKESEKIFTPSRQNSSKPIARFIGFFETNFLKYPKNPL